ncbi:hypothetical protein [uncultured Treponema sp.]|nr:hypothetical protein [uncultured Treponema sp.]
MDLVAKSLEKPLDRGMLMSKIIQKSEVRSQKSEVRTIIFSPITF